MFKSGFVTIIGKANVGKSTLLNALVGEQVAIVSPRPQTTRDKIIGIMNGDNYQAVFIDSGVFCMLLLFPENTFIFPDDDNHEFFYDNFNQYGI